MRLSILPARLAYAVVLGALVIGAAQPVSAQNPVLAADHFSLELNAQQAFSRAEDAIRAAGLTVDPATDLSRGGHKDNLTVLIHCVRNGNATLVDLEVATIGSRDACLAMRGFLAEFMKSGKGPAIRGDGFAGDWDTRSQGGFAFRMKLKQEGNRVTGTYEGGTTGTLDGTVTGNILRFRWVQANGSKGSGKLTLAGDGKAFTGFYSYGENFEADEGYWNGQRPAAK
jgi:hypothetical protein